MHIFILSISLLAAVNAMSGGRAVTSSEQFPFFVTLTTPILCGGTIISLDPAWIITAAHCIEDSTSGSLIGYGSREFSKQTYATIKQIVLHPLYVSNKQLETQVYASNRTDIVPYDIGLLQLTKPLPQNEYTDRIPLLADQEIATLETMGMGYTGYQQPHADLLQYTECNSSRTGVLHDDNFNHSIILAHSEANLCHGDSGSPLVTKLYGSNSYYLAGILNRILNAYDPDPNQVSCPFHQSESTLFVNAFVKPYVHIKWIMNSTQLSKEALLNNVYKPVASHASSQRRSLLMFISCLLLL
ncbi:hypothetical protein CU098_008529 [Rhizopus stolonifer]|uniref:Peptidase S1 domain-containing protein n=1 Tax=Rhizopus stolonifer TaxID=4846 RepID=A0A367KJS1_RHIST|nr:hypothetical protein CU098_008529 [Rhizopus stolonifer]